MEGKERDSGDAGKVGLKKLLINPDSAVSGMIDQVFADPPSDFLPRTREDYQFEAVNPMTLLSQPKMGVRDIGRQGRLTACLTRRTQSEDQLEILIRKSSVGKYLALVAHLLYISRW